MITIVHVVDASLSAAALERLRVLLDRLPRDRFAQRVQALDARTMRRIEAHAVRRCGEVVGSAVRTVTLAEAAALHSRQGPHSVPYTVAPFGSRPYHDETDAVVHAWGMRAWVERRLRSDAPGVVSMDAPPPDEAARRGVWAAMAEETVLVTGGQEARRGMARCGVRPERIVVVRGPVDFAAINAARRAGARRAFISDKEGPLILTSGPASRGGGQFQVAWAAAILQQIHPHARFITPFDSPERDRARRLLDAAKTGAMWVEAPAEWGWAELVAAADVFVDAADASGPTEPIAWAMAAGAPIVGTAIRSITELIADHHNGLLVRDNAPRGLAAAMLTLLEDVDLRRTLTETARGQAYEVFSARAYADNMARVYENAAERRSPGEGVRDMAMVGG